MNLTTDYPQIVGVTTVAGAFAGIIPRIVGTGIIVTESLGMNGVLRTRSSQHDVYGSPV